MRNIDEILKAMGRAIAAERNRQGLTQSQLAMMMGQSDHAYVSRVENGKQIPSLASISSFANALNVNVGHFFIGF